MTIFHVIQFYRSRINDVDFDGLPSEVRDAWLMTAHFHSLPNNELLSTLKQLLLEYDGPEPE